MRIVKKLSYEARVVRFIQNYKKYFDAFEKRMGKDIIRKADFLRAIIRIKSSLVALKNAKTSYKKTKNKQYKVLIKHSVKNIRENKRTIKAILEMNRNYYYIIMFPQLANLDKTR